MIRPSQSPPESQSRQLSVFNRLLQHYLPITDIQALRSDGAIRRAANGNTCVIPLGYAAAGWVSSRPLCATAAVAEAAYASPATCTVGKVNLMSFSSNAFLIIA